MTHPLAALIAGVKVKPLEWNDSAFLEQYAKSVAGTYRVFEKNGLWWTTIHTVNDAHFIAETDALDAAKAAAQADYEARILAALEAATPPDLVAEAGKVLEQWAAYVESMGSVMGEAEHIAQQMHDTLRAIIALATAQAAQIAGLTKERDRYLRHLTAGAESLNAHNARADAAEAEATTLRAEVERLRGAIDTVLTCWAYQLPKSRHPMMEDGISQLRAALEGKNE